MPEYRLSSAAEEDLIGIARYGDEHFGLAQSDRHRDQFKRRFSVLAAHPMRYPGVDHIYSGYRRSVCGVHSIYYRIDPDGVLIVRILGRQDTSRALHQNLHNDRLRPFSGVWGAPQRSASSAGEKKRSRFLSTAWRSRPNLAPLVWTTRSLVVSLPVFSNGGKLLTRKGSSGRPWIRVRI